VLKSSPSECSQDNQLIHRAGRGMKRGKDLDMCLHTQQHRLADSTTVSLDGSRGVLDNCSLL
jgi:hypothetical protein